MAAAAPAAGQSPATIQGRVLRRAPADTVPAAGARVVLHRVSRGPSGPVDSVATTADGGFRFSLRPDTSVIYLVSARWAGIEYFSEPLPGSSLAGASRLALLVADTSSGAAVDVAGRYFVVGAPDTGGVRTAVDLFALRNRGAQTRVAPDSLTPVWRHVLPPGAEAHAVAQAGSEIAADAVRFVGDTVLVFAPVAPGEKQLLLQHSFPAGLGAIHVPLGDGADSVQVVAEEPGVVVQGLARAEAQELDGRPFARWIGAGRGVSEVRVLFPRARVAERWLAPALAGATLLLTAGLAVILGRRRGRPAPAESATRPDVDALVDRIARLDADHQRGAPTGAEAYHAERARLKRELAAALAARRPSA